MDHVKNLERAIAEFEEESKKIGNYNVLLEKLKQLLVAVEQEKSLFKAVADDFEAANSALQGINNEFQAGCQGLQSMIEQQEQFREKFAGQLISFAATEKEQFGSFLQAETQARKELRDRLHNIIVEDAGQLVSLAATEKEQFDSFLQAETQAREELRDRLHNTIVEDAGKIMHEAGAPLQEAEKQLTAVNHDLKDLLTVHNKLREEILNSIDSAMISNTRKHLNMYSSVTAEVAGNISESTNRLNATLSELYQQNLLLERKLATIENGLHNSLEMLVAKVQNIDTKLDEINGSVNALGSIRVLVIIAIVVGIVSCIIKS